MKSILLLLLFFTVCWGCNKENMPEVQPSRVDTIPIQPSQTGAVSLTVPQASNAVKFRISSTSLDTSILFGNTSSNVFLLRNLPAGQYNVSVIPKIGYLASTNSQVVIHGGDTANAGTFILTANGSPGFLRFSLSGNPVRDTFDFSPPDVQCAYLGGAIYITTSQPILFPYWYFDFKVSSVAATGTYTISFPNPNSYVRASRFTTATSSTVYTSNKHNFDLPSSSGRVVINVSVLDRERNVISGTFSGLLLPEGGVYTFGNPAKRVTNGSFQLNY